MRLLLSWEVVIWTNALQYMSPANLKMDTCTDKMQHRVLLLKLSQRLTKSDLEELVFLCEDVLTESAAEEIKSAISLFRELGHRGRLAPGDYDFVRECLLNIGREDLANILPEKQENSDGLHQSFSQLSTSEKIRTNRSTEIGNSVSNWKKTLLLISNQLRAKDLEKMAYLCSFNVNSGGLSLIKSLERRSAIKEGNCDYLSDVLTEIGRCDLSKLCKAVGHITSKL